MISLRTARFDELGLRRSLADRLVPFLVASMGFLAALAIAGWLGTAVLARHWETGAGAALTVQVPRPTERSASGGDTRLSAVLARLNHFAGIESAAALTPDQINALLTSWLGTDVRNLAIPIPAVIAVKLTGDPIDLPDLTARLAEIAPGTVLEDHAAWAGRLEVLARSLQLCAGLVVLIVTLVTAAVIMVVTRSSLAARRDDIMIVYQLGATDSYIVRRFANRTAAQAAIGSGIGGLFALPVIFALATLVMPFGGQSVAVSGLSEIVLFLPLTLWLLPIVLPVVAALVGYLTTQATMRRWLSHLR